MRLHRHRLAVLFSRKSVNEAIGTKFTVVTGYQGGGKLIWQSSAAKRALPQPDDIFRPRAVSQLAQARFCPADPANGKKKRSSSPRRSVHL